VLTINTSPTITTQPVSQTVTAGNPVTFTAAASGTPTPSFQWMKNGSAISGATSSSYSLAIVGTGNAGSYTVVATNVAGSAASSAAVLTVNAATVAPTISTQPVSQTVTSGNAATFTVIASGTPAPTYQWNKNGSAISGATGASYTIASTTTGSAGTYTVVATNTAGAVTSSSAVLTINTPPGFTTQPSSQTVIAGNSVTFAAAAGGSPSPTFQWKKNGSSISGATSASYTISSVATGNAGSYTVVATNSAGAVISNAATLTVNPTPSAPAFSIQPVDQSVISGSSVTFIAAANGTPTPTFQWMKDGVAIAGATSASYTIPTTATTDAAAYTVVATNSVSSVTSNAATLSVLVAPKNVVVTLTVQ
jgi:large repetitive protein